MSDLDAQIPTAFDPFADANADDSGAGTKEYVHIRIQQRNGRKSLTTVQGLKKEFSYNKILKDLKREFCCNGTVVQDPELGQVIQLQGDQRKNVSNFLVQAGIVKKENIKIHDDLPLRSSVTNSSPPWAFASPPTSSWMELGVPYDDVDNCVVVRHAPLSVTTVMSRRLARPNVKLFNAVAAEENVAEDNIVRLIREVVPGMIVTGMEIERARRVVSKSDLSSLFRCKILFFQCKI
ncbi:hypothetical protein OPV22_003615 [Ensete ventricosum]|uniref:Protein translation factor SUI1 homolog n=1 Tax=Ensete ventricosum TaxID=4639 RepID=A0AAV8S188_ENSVE|nr:hypothetical protein OPV22_003615 [Ensete ventricosum]